MNLSAWLGLGVAAAVIYFGVIHPSPSPGLFFDPHALLLVCGGTLATALISMRFSKIEDLVALFFYGLLLKRTKSRLQYARNVLELGVLADNSKGKEITFDASHPFFKEAVFLMGKEFLSNDEFATILSKRSDYFRQMYQGDAKSLNALGKFPPAFGLLGATTGMIAMMQNLGAGNTGQIGPAMAVALVATFWGIGVANFLILPLADYASKAAQEDKIIRQMIIEGATMIRAKTSPSILAERLATYLPPHQRDDLREGYKAYLRHEASTAETVVDISPFRRAK